MCWHKCQYAVFSLTRTQVSRQHKGVHTNVNTARKSARATLEVKQLFLDMPLVGRTPASARDPLIAL